MKGKIKFEDINWNTDDYPLSTDPKLSMEDLVKALGAKPIIKLDEKLVDPSHVASIFKENKVASLRPQKKTKIRFYTLEQLQNARIPRRAFPLNDLKSTKIEGMIGVGRARFLKRKYLSTKVVDTVELYIHKNGLISSKASPIKVVLGTHHRAGCVVTFEREPNSHLKGSVSIKMTNIKSINMGINRAVIKTVRHSFDTSVTVANVIVGLNPKIDVVETEKIKR